MHHKMPYLQKRGGITQTDGIAIIEAYPIG